MKCILWPAFLLLSLHVRAQKTDHRLQKQIEQLLTGFNGHIGVYVHDLKKDRVAELNGDSLFPTASVIKIPILIGICRRIQLQELDYQQEMIYKDTLNYDPGEDILASFKPEEKIRLSKLMLLSITLSDNTASLLLQGLAGGGTRINGLMDSLGLKYTRVNSRTAGREQDRNKYGWGQTTPREIASLMERIAFGKIFSSRLSERMLRILGRQYWDENALSQIPANVFVASKSGAVDESRNEVLYVNGPHPYVFSIFTKDNKDQRWDYNNEACVLTRRLSALLWKYFNPAPDWTGVPVKN
ncbi:MAG TPA: serine hydrolase [Puia sp.]|jgi:beta-lactamase class A